MATKKSNKQLWIMLALIAVIIAAILLLPSCGSRGGKAEADTESTTLVKAGDKAPTSPWRCSTAQKPPSQNSKAKSCY